MATESIKTFLIPRMEVRQESEAEKYPPHIPPAATALSNYPSLSDFILGDADVLALQSIPYSGSTICCRGIDGRQTISKGPQLESERSTHGLVGS